MKKLITIYGDSYRGLSTEAWLLAVVMLINRTGSMVIPFLGMYMSSALHFTKPQVGMVLGCFGLGSVCGSWLGGWLTDRLGNYRVQAYSLILTVPIFLLLPNFKTFESLAGMIFLLTLIADTFRPANSVSVARYAKPENLTKAYSLNRMAVNLGFSIGPALAGFLATFSYDWIFYGNAIAALAAAIVFIIVFRNRAPRNKIGRLLKGARNKAEGDRNAYLDTPFIIFNVFCFLFSMAFFQLLSTLPLFYKEARMMSEGEIGILLGFSGFCIVVFEMLLVHAVEHRFTPRQVMIYGTGIAGVAYLMLNVPYGLPWLYISMFILSIGEMLTLPFTATISASRASLKTQGAYMGFNSLAFAAANIFSPYIGTYVAAHYGYEILWFGTAAVLLFASAGFAWILKKM
ncbi:MFS transporter [Sphingobacterium griseoflavum]|uniref:MFS transporter n=1 Tax=Sphingobacterium griseoflavum TaxID=1474952 RepID=A0ABQ3HUG4_9SPHI|nr:MFS transporter [Sphingobacterium griseoflavum]GHE35585.1 MFS transporter [Sphingobacterium griseoflavum]